jgi:thioredoxin-like negative regulator of GroEL
MNSGVIPALTGLSPMLKGIFGFVGIVSIVVYAGLAIYTKESFNELCRDGAVLASFLFICAMPSQGAGCAFLAVVANVAFWFFVALTWRKDLGWLVVVICAVLWGIGVSFYLYEPIAGMTDPPMQWGYPRTVEGFFHALSRGQYESVNPTNILANPGQFVQQLGMLTAGLASSYGWVNLLIGLLPILFILKMQKRERAWIVGLGAIYACVGLLLVILMDTTPDRQTAEENKVFFTASHAVIAIFIGYGLALLSAYMATHYKNFRIMGLAMGVAALVPAGVGFYDNLSTTFLGGAGLLNYYTVLALFFCLAAVFVLAAMATQQFLKLKGSSSPDDRFIFQMLAGGACVLLAVSIFLAFLSSDRLSVGEMLGSLPRIFAPHQYNLPVIGGIWLVAIVVAYIVALAVYRNRAPVAITLALFAITPGYSVMTHWAKCEQRNHWFGYWFGHDMFTPPFNIYPEMDRNTILFGGTDPGRFCPTYMIFCESFIPASCKPMDPKFDRRDVYLITQNALADNTYLDYLRAQYFRSQQKDPPFFSNLIDYVAGLGHFEDNSLVQFSSKEAYNWLDIPFTARGAKIEKRWRSEGVYPPKEIYIPSPDDSEKSFRDYTQDAATRRDEGRLDPGEEVDVDPASGRVAVSGQVAVMKINGLLCKVIFDQNPTNAFYVEESFPLEWMYPYETPFGIIMKINRQPVVTFPDEVYTNDHEFWSKYSDRLIGNWITYDTSVKQITDWVQKVYLQNDYNDYKGDLKFIRDEDAQKAFSKLRSSQAGMYAWRLHLLLPSPPYPPVDPQYMPYRPKSDAEVQKLYRECDFAFKQSFAYCPYSPEAVVRYCNFLFQFQRFDDALLVAQTCHKLDPYNDQITDLIKQINGIKQQESNPQSSAQNPLQEMQAELSKDPGDFENVVKLVSYYQQYQPAMATSILKQDEPYADLALANPNTTEHDLSAIVQIYAQLGELPKVEQSLKKMVVLLPDQPEVHYDLAAVMATLGETSGAMGEFKTAMALNAARLKTNSSALNLVQQARNDPHFATISNLPEFKELVPAS